MPLCDRCGGKAQTHEAEPRRNGIFDRILFSEDRKTAMLYIGFVWVLLYFFAEVANFITRLVAKNVAFQYSWTYLIIANLFIVGSFLIPKEAKK